MVGNVRAKAMVRIRRMSDNESRVTLTLQAEKEGTFGSWESLPMTTDMKASYEEFFQGVAEILESY